VGIPVVSRDAEIMDALLRGIRSNASVPDSITAEVRDGWVTLRGDADFRYESKAAERAAGSIDGVEGITNEINVLARPLLDLSPRRRRSALRLRR
jgi:osmotically-inducible protein OsmY